MWSCSSSVEVSASQVTLGCVSWQLKWTVTVIFFKNNNVSLAWLFQLHAAGDAMSPRGEPTTATSQTSAIFLIASWAFILTTTQKCRTYSSPKRLLFAADEYHYKNSQLVKNVENSQLLGFPSPTDTSTMQHQHLSLRNFLKQKAEERLEEREDQEGCCGIVSSIYDQEAVLTHKIWIIWLPKQGLHNDNHLTCWHGWGGGNLTVPQA